MRTAKTLRKPRRVKTWAEIEATPNGKCIIEKQNAIIARLEAYVVKMQEYIDALQHAQKVRNAYKQRVIRERGEELDWVYATYPEIADHYRAMQDLRRKK